MVALAAAVLAAGIPPAAAQQKPAELRVGAVAFLSGAAAVFDVPGRNAAE